eukprot:15470021-Alexandrium_andersonii.AAC.1
MESAGITSLDDVKQAALPTQARSTLALRVTRRYGPTSAADRRPAQRSRPPPFRTQQPVRP